MTRSVEIRRVVASTTPSMRARVLRRFVVAASIGLGTLHMSNASWSRTIAQPLRELLKPRGFKKTGLTFSRPLDDVDHLIGLQKSMASTADESRVTLNLAVWVRRLATVRAGLVEKPNIWDAHWRLRIGQLMPAHADRWWTITSDDQAILVGSEIAAAVSQYGLPVLGELMDADAVIALWRRGRAPGLTEKQRQQFLEKYERLAG